MRSLYQHPVIVVGLSPTGLGLVRSLAPYCADITAIESNRAEPGVCTRLAKVHLVADLSNHDELERTLIGLGERAGCKPVLFLSSDEHVLWAARRRETLDQHFHLLLPPLPTCEQLMWKDQFLALAARDGLPVPQGAFLPVRGLGEAVASLGLTLPVIIKPSNKAGAWERSGLAKAYIARSMDEVRMVGSLATEVVDDVLVQEYLEGDDGQIFFCLYLSAPQMPRPVTFVGRKILQWPPLRGSTAACEPADAPDLEAFTRDLFQRLGVEGFCSLEVKYGPDGFRIIEPTVGRVDLQSQVATLNGVNMPLVAYLASLGLSDQATAHLVPTTERVTWLHEPSLYALARTGSLPAAQLLSLFKRKRGWAFGTRSDMGPLGAYVEERLGALMRKFVPRKDEQPRPTKSGAAAA
jgi:D-aspartate ligase